MCNLDSSPNLRCAARLKLLWRDPNINLKIKIRLLRALVISIFLDACVTRAVTTEPNRRIQSM